MEAAMSELGPEARSLLDGGRNGDDPSPADRARLRASVMRAVAAGGAIGAAATAAEATAAAKTASGLGLLWKIGGAVLLCAASAGTTVVVIERGAPPAAPAPPSAVAPVAAPPPPPLPAPPPAAEPSPRATAAPTPRPVPSAERQRDPQLEETPPPAAEAPPPAVTAAPAPPPDTLAAETQRLREANGALRGGDAQRALALLDEQSAGGAQLREERAAARILALCDLGRTDEARAQAAAFLQKSPQSPLADRVRKSCAGR
jgi:hypothetical protein